MDPNPHPPLAVRRAHGLWLLAVVAGIYETGLAIAHGYPEAEITTDQLVANLLVRGAVFGLAIFLAQRMRGGSNAARWVLTGLLGVVGLGSLLYRPGRVGARRAHPADLDFSALEWIFATSRVVHVCAVVGALAAMFTPDANRWFAPRTAMIGATS